MKAGVYGVVGEFESDAAILRAATEMREAGYLRLEAFTPFPVEGLAERIGFRRNAVPLISLLCGIAGGSAGYFMMWYAAVISYPINVGGRPLHSWPAFIPITFELTVLSAALGAVVGMLALNGLPRLHHPIFHTPYYVERGQSRFYLCVRADDMLYEAGEIGRMLRRAGAGETWEVPE